MPLLQVAEVTDQANVWLVKGKTFIADYGLKIVGAILIYIIGSWIIKKLSQGLGKVFAAKKYDPSLQTFLRSLITVSLNVLLIILVIAQLGVNTASFAALLAGAGLAIGAALNGTLGNLAGGVMLLIFKPFKIGDIIEAQSQTGVVKELNIFNTILLTPENKTVILANGALSTGTIVNYNTHGNLRVDITMAIAASEDIDKARSVAVEAILTHPKVLKMPAPGVAVSKVENGMVVLSITSYTTQADYWDVYFGVQELVKKAWDKAGVEAPVPHQVVINK